MPIVLTHGRQPERMKPAGTPIGQHKHVCGPDAEHDERMAIQAVTPSLPARPREIFGDGQRIHVADTAAIEVAVCRMVNRMRLLPVRVRRQREDSKNPAEPVVRAAVREKGCMAAIMLDQKDPHEKAARDDRQRCDHPERVPSPCDRDQYPHRDEWPERHNQLDDRASVRGCSESRQRSRPLCCRRGRLLADFAGIGAWRHTRRVNSTCAAESRSCNRRRRFVSTVATSHGVPGALTK